MSWVAQSVNSGAHVTDMDQLLSQHGKVITSIIKCWINLLIHFPKFDSAMQFYLAPHWACDYLFMGLKLNHVTKGLLLWCHSKIRISHWVMETPPSISKLVCCILIMITAQRPRDKMTQWGYCVLQHRVWFILFHMGAKSYMIVLALYLYGINRTYHWVCGMNEPMPHCSGLYLLLKIFQIMVSDDNIPP